MNASGVPASGVRKTALVRDYTKAENITGAEPVLNFI
jgi:hypothetical protein